MMKHYHIIQAYWYSSETPKIKFVDHRFHVSRIVPVKGKKSLLEEMEEILRSWGQEIIGFGTGNHGYFFISDTFESIKQ